VQIKILVHLGGRKLGIGVCVVGLLAGAIFPRRQGEKHMTASRTRGKIGVLIAGSLLFSSTGAAAAAAVPTYQPDPWAVLSVMSGGSAAAAVCGASVGAAAATAAAQPAAGCVLPQVDVAPAAAGPPQPVPPVAAESAGLGISPILLGLAAIAAAVGLYLILHHKNHHHANSPA
jgi:hypothetical protein